MPNKQAKDNVLLWLVTTILAWLGLAGLGDNFLTWKDWFDDGIYRHYSGIRGYFLNFLPVRVPNWVFDVIMINTLILRADFATQEEHRGVDIWREFLSECKENVKNGRWIRASMGGIAACLLFLPIMIFVLPVIFLSVQVGYLFQGETKAGMRTFILGFWTPVLLFVPVLFVITHEFPKVLN